MTASAPLATTAPTQPDSRPAVSAPQPILFTLSKVDDERLVDGVTIRYSDRRHKHGQGFTTGIVELTFTREGKTEVQELRGERGVYRAEWLVFDRVIIVTANANEESLLISIPGGKAPEPLTREAAMSMLREAAAKQGLSVEGDNASRLEYGVLQAIYDGEPGWSGQIGVFSREIYELRKLTKGESRLP